MQEHKTVKHQAHPVSGALFAFVLFSVDASDQIAYFIFYIDNTL